MFKGPFLDKKVLLLVHYVAEIKHYIAGLEFNVGFEIAISLQKNEKFTKINSSQTLDLKKKIMLKKYPVIKNSISVPRAYISTRFKIIATGIYLTHHVFIHFRSQKLLS